MPLQEQRDRRWLQAGVVLLLALLLPILAACGGDDGPAGTPPAASTLPAGTLPRLDTGRDITAVDGRYTLRIPVGWTPINDPIAELAYQDDDPLEARRFNIAREVLAQIREPLAYAEAAQRRIRGQLTDVLTLSLDVMRANDRSGARWVYTATVDGETVLFYQFFLIDAGEGFVFTGVASPESGVDSVRQFYDRIVGTFAFGRG